MPLVLHPIVDQAELDLFMSWAHGGGDGIIRFFGDEFEVTEQDTPSMRVDIGTGIGYVSYRRIHQFASAASSTISAPSGGNDRIDLVQWTLGVGLNILTGVEDPSPDAPDADSNSLVPAQIYCRDTMTVIKDSDDATNGYITKTPVYL